ncbi:unnamed protein product [Rotaria sp. Silwood2]|nr:unnamed protein product [Rotaria sp. Silwood2]CAF4387802.1 unnamed protein product [Rotaria sp. Silwood2]
MEKFFQKQINRKAATTADIINDDVHFGSISISDGTIKKITNAIDQISLEKTKVQLLSSSSELDDLEQMFQNIRCSNDLYMLKHLEINSQLDTITCIPCFKFKKQPSKHLLSTIKSSFDIFEYVEQDPHQIQSQGLKSLTRNLKLHYENRLHMWCVKEDEPVKQELHDFIKKIEKLGSILVEQRYFAFKIV